MKKLLLTAALAVIGTLGANAQIVFSGSYSENFNGLPSTSAASAFSATVGAQSAVSGVSDWSGTKASGTGTTATALTADSGAGNGGGLYSYTAFGSAGTDRALGSLASGSNVMNFGVLLTNTTGATITSLNLAFDREQYRSSTTNANVLSFSYGIVDGVTITNANYLTAAGATADTTFNLVGDAPVVTNGILDPPTTLAVSGSLSGLNWLAGSTLFFRWADVNETGNDAGIAIDNFSLSAVPEPSTYALIGMGLFGLVVLRRMKSSKI